jgi:hypothetical protein
MAIRGAIAYEVEDEEVFTITYPKPGGHTLTASPLWTTTSFPESDFLTVSELISEDVGLVPTDAIMGRTAAAAFIQNARVLSLLDNRRVDFGFMELQNQFRDDGAIYMGFYGGMRCWRYGRAINVNGVATRLIRDDYVEFVTASPAAPLIGMRSKRISSKASAFPRAGCRRIPAFASFWRTLGPCLCPAGPAAWSVSRLRNAKSIMPPGCTGGPFPT